MNIKKRVLSIFAAVTAFAALSAATVGATNLGYSDGDVVDEASIAITLSDTEATNATLNISDLTVDLSIPADAFDTDSVNFVAKVIENADVTAALNKVDGDVKSAKSLDLYFTDSNDNVIDATGKNIEVTFKDVSYNNVFYFDPETKALEKVTSTFANNALTFTAPHFSIYALAEIADASNPTPSNPSSPSTPSDTSNPSDGKTAVSTGDSSATVIIISAIAVVALATVVIATKAKKSSR